MPEAIPELIYVAAFLAALCGYLASRGLLTAWTHTLGYMLQWLGSELDFSFTILGRRIGVNIGGVFKTADKWVVTALQAWADGAETQMAYCLHGMTKLMQYTAEAIDYLAGETSRTFDWAIHIKIPKWLRQFVTFGALGAIVGRMIADALRHAIVHTLKIVHSVTHEITHSITHVVRTVVHTAYALPGWVIHIPRELKGVDRSLGRIEHRLRPLEALLGVTGMAVAIANVFGIPNWRCLTRGNVGRTMRGLCGIPTHLLDDLLTLIADFVVLDNICAVLPWLEAGVSAVATPVIEALTDAGAGLCDPSSSVAEPLPVPALHLTATPGLTTALV